MSLTCRIHGAKDLRLEDDPAVELGAHEVEMKLGAGGICGSDLHYYQHGRVGAFVVREPLIPGHEVSGVVARIGAGVTRVKVGDKVLYSKYGGTEVKYAGEEYLVLSARDVLAVIEG